MATALITGGTSGIGAEFARTLASRGTDLVLVARDRERLDKTARELTEQFGVSVDVLPADLSDRTQVNTVIARLEDPSAPIDLFINNAGFGLNSRLLDPDTETHERAISVMITAVYLLATAAARAMLKRGSGRIINVASSAAYITTGNYSAVKVYVLNFTEGLSNELRGTNVTVTALCPGWVHTEFHDRAGIRSNNIPPAAWIPIETVVTEGLAASERGAVICVPSKRWKVATTLARLVPRSVIRAVSHKLSSSRHTAA